MKRVLSKYRHINLTNGGTARVSREDYAKISKYKWTSIQCQGLCYATARINGETIYMHKLITGTVGKGRQVYVDHRDRNGLHNERDNLRVCDNTRNQWNTGNKGVSWVSKSNKWWVRIRIGGGKRINGGYFTNEDEAGLRYNELALEHHGEFAVLNDIPA